MAETKQLPIESTNRLLKLGGQVTSTQKLQVTSTISNLKKSNEKHHQNVSPSQNQFQRCYICVHKFEYQYI